MGDIINAVKSLVIDGEGKAGKKNLSNQTAHLTQNIFLTSSSLQPAFLKTKGGVICTGKTNPDLKSE